MANGTDGTAGDKRHDGTVGVTGGTAGDKRHEGMIGGTAGTAAELPRAAFRA